MVFYKDHVTNEQVCVTAKIQQALGPHEDLLTIIKRRKLQWYGHVSHPSGLAKTILQGTVKGERRQGRQRERWEDNIRQWTGLEYAKSQRAVENRGKWRKLVAKSSVVAQWPSWLRDRWDEMRVYNKCTCLREQWAKLTSNDVFFYLWLGNNEDYTLIVSATLLV